MGAYRLFLATAFSFAIAGFASAPLRAQDIDQPPVENSKYNVLGQINANAVTVRSGPGENYYPTTKLDKGAPITVVGIKFDWLKIVPPEGSFCYVAKAYVEKRGDGTVGRVTRPDLNVRAGSSLTAMKQIVLTKLNQNEDVTILGEQDEYFKIKPPEGAYLYVKKDFVDLVKHALPVAADPNVKSVTGSPADATAMVPQLNDAGPIASDPILPNADQAAAPTTQSTDATVMTAAPTTQQTASADEQAFDKLEAQFLTVSSEPLENQPIAEMLSAYETLTKSQALPESMKRIADARLSTLKIRSEARDQVLAVRKRQQEMEARLTPLKAEREELEQRVKENAVQLFTAVGTLRTSSLQKGTQTLYRLTDPQTGRTVVYLRTTDPKYTAALGQFIGVKGALETDNQLGLKVVAPTSYEMVDPSKVNQGVTAQVIPPSLLPRATANSME